MGFAIDWMSLAPFLPRLIRGEHRLKHRRRADSLAQISKLPVVNQRHPSSRLQATLEERSLPDDSAASAFEEGDLVVVLRLRMEGHRRILIVDDGNAPVQTDVSDSREILEFVLPADSAGPLGYQAAREAIVRAFLGGAH
jgi:hypothetical protein